MHSATKMAAIKFAVIGVSLAALAACSTDLEKLRKAPSQANSDFTRALDSEYREQAERQWAWQNDFASSEYFARKGMRVTRGETVAPERPEDNNWRPDAAVAGDIAAARTRLTTALSANATQRAPAAAAKAQVAYDCWLEEADDPIFSPENDWKRAKVNSCRDDFNAAMAAVDAAMRPAPTPPARTGVEVQRSYLVFFDWDKSNITAEARRVVAQAAASARQVAVTRIEVAGHADRSGSERYNQALSQRRADAVKQALIAEGVAVNQIVTMAFGESRPLVPTADGVREPQNRRVEIVLR